LTRLPRPRVSIAVLAALVVVAAGVGVWRRAASDDGMTATVRRGPITSTLTLAGILKPAESITYRSPLGGRETEVTFLAPEGTRVNEGDLIVRLDTTEVERELQRVAQEVRQAQVDLQLAEIEVQEGKAAIASLEKGEGALNLEETRTRLELAQKKVDRLREEHGQLKPLMEKGFITREELRRTADELEQAEEELVLARRRSEILVEQTRPRDKQRAELQLAQKEAQRENIRTRVQEAAARGQVLQEQFENCSVYARRPGMVVYEEYLGANPRRKIRVGDRATGSQVLVTIPEVTRMLVEASASEADVHRLHPGQPAAIRLEAFPDLRLTGKVVRVGTLARSDDRPIDDKRFDVTVEVDAAHAELRPEMTARVDILTGERVDVLLLPVNAVFDRQGAPVCHVMTRTGVETRPVQLGESSETEVEVIAGVQEGERVRLMDTVATPGSASGPGIVRPVAPLRPLSNQGNQLAPR
jgi:multidrug efflux pump subunit AcrA (membrane-fusion protein)